MKPKKTKGVLFLRGVDRAVKNQFKATCARREVTMTRMVERFMRMYSRHPDKFDRMVPDEGDDE